MRITLFQYLNVGQILPDICANWKKGQRVAIDKTLFYHFQKGVFRYLLRRLQKMILRKKYSKATLSRFESSVFLLNFEKFVSFTFSESEKSNEADWNKKSTWKS